MSNSSLFSFALHLNGNLTHANWIQRLCEILVESKCVEYWERLIKDLKCWNIWIVCYNLESSSANAWFLSIYNVMGKFYSSHQLYFLHYVKCILQEYPISIQWKTIHKNAIKFYRHGNNLGLKLCVKGVGKKNKNIRILILIFHDS